MSFLDRRHRVLRRLVNDVLHPYTPQQPHPTPGSVIAHHPAHPQAAIEPAAFTPLATRTIPPHHPEAPYGHCPACHQPQTGDGPCIPCSRLTCGHVDNTPESWCHDQWGNQICSDCCTTCNPQETP